MPHLSRRDHLGSLRVRLGWKRRLYRVVPGLYAVGQPDGDSPVLVTANYKLSFDHLRCQLQGLSVWILVLDTRGINVWCAAGKGTFGSDELIRQVVANQLAERLNHRSLILPQFGAVGVAAHEVLRQCGFRVVYGPLRAHDLPAFLANGQQASPRMRQVTFDLGERLLLTPVEIMLQLKKFYWVLPLLAVLAGLGPGFWTSQHALERTPAAWGAWLLAILAGCLLTPAMLPWLSGRAFAAKGAVMGLICSGAVMVVRGADLNALDVAALLLSVPAFASWCGLQFTGATPYTSLSGVAKEMRVAVPLQGVSLLGGFVFWLVAGLQ